VRLGRALLPIITRLPFQLIYPTGEKQDKTSPKQRRWLEWADIIAGDFHYIRRNLPDNLEGKVVLTNTTTEEDREVMAARRRAAGGQVDLLVPLENGRRPREVLEFAPALDELPDGRLHRFLPRSGGCGGLRNAAVYSRIEIPVTMLRRKLSAVRPARISANTASRGLVGRPRRPR